MAALRDELTTAVKRLRAFLIRKIWSTSSSEKNQQAVDSFDIESLLQLIEHDPEHAAIWQRFYAFHQRRDQRYFQHNEQKRIHALIQCLKQIEQGHFPNSEAMVAHFDALNIAPMVPPVRQAVVATIESAPEVIEAPAPIDAALHDLPIDVLQKLILEINTQGQLPEHAKALLAPYHAALSDIYPDAPDIHHASPEQQLIAVIQLVDFFEHSAALHHYGFGDHFATDLADRQSLMTHKRYFDAIERLKNAPKENTKYLKDVHDLVSAAQSKLLFVPSDATLTLCERFIDEENAQNAARVLSALHTELSGILNAYIQKAAPVVEMPSMVDTTVSTTSEHTKHPYYIAGRLMPTFKECPQYDDELIAELKESFLEESEDEIFPLIEIAVQNLRANPYKETDILDLRRCFHTLKGSGYTASMPIIGEIGWQVERVINGVRDNHYPFSDAILHHALDGYDAIRALIAHPSEDTTELERIAYQAQYLIDHKGQVDPADVSMPAEAIEPTPVASNDTTEHFENFDAIPFGYVSPYHLEGSAEAEPSEAAQLDEDLVVVLKENMLEETQREILPALNDVSSAFLKDAATQSDFERARRAFHTIKGNARMIGLNVLGEITGTAEKLLDKILSGAHKLTPATTAHLADIYLMVKAQISNQTVPDEEIARLLNQGNMLLAHKGDLSAFLNVAPPVVSIVPEVINEAETDPNPASTEDLISEKRQAMFENIQSVIEQSEMHERDYKLHDEELNLTNEELSQKLISGFTKCETRTYSTLKRYSQDVGLCLLHPNFSQEFPLHQSLISAYHKHLLLFRAHGLTPLDERLIFWGKVLTAVLTIIKTNTIDAKIAQNYIDELQKPILTIEQAEASPAPQPIAETQEEIDPEIMQAFTEEAHEVLEQADELIQAWQGENFNPQSDLISELRRQMHTLKGGARMVGKEGLGQLSHALESLLDANYITLFDSDPKRFEVLQRALDHLQVLLESPAKTLDREGFNLLSALHLLLGHENPPEMNIEGEVITESNATVVSEQTAIAAQAELSTLKITPMQLSRISEKVSENNILTTQYNNAVSSIINTLSELTRTMQYLNMTARNIEIETEAQMISRHAKASQNKESFDPLELDQFSELQHLARSISESIEDVNEFHRHIAESVESMNASLSKFSGNQTLISDTLTDIGTVSFNHIVPRLRRIVRQVSKSNNKQVDLVAIGADTQVERLVLEQMTAAFEHMIRNAIVHGIESPEERINAGKSPNGTITLRVMKTGSDLSIEISDDGRGFNVEKIREKAIAQGLVTEAHTLTDHDLVNLIMLPGFTTATKLSQDAGRGVGLDVLAKAMTILKGNAELSFVPNQGVTFKISIPATLMIVQSLIVSADGQKYAIPIDDIIGVTQEKDVIFDRKRTHFVYHNEKYDVYDLDRIYSGAHAGHLNYIYLLFEFNGQPIALGAESIISQLEVIMHPLNPQIAHIPGLTGSAVTPDGETIFTVDISAFTKTDFKQAHKRDHVQEKIQESKEAQPHKPLVMVVDDSITMRRVSQRMLERAGYEVILAKDGLEAIETLVNVTPDLIMLDIEMPRMDGFEVLTRIRETEKLMKTPVMMVTSRSGEKHRMRAFDIGANEYCGKPYQEEEILKVIDQLLNAKA